MRFVTLQVYAVRSFRCVMYVCVTPTSRSSVNPSGLALFEAPSASADALHFHISCETALMTTALTSVPFASPPGEF